MIPINKQPIEKRDHNDGSTLDVHSIFYTIQGEGPFTGHAAVFVRLAGCNLQCPGCDTDYTSSRENMLVSEIINSIKESQYCAMFFKALIVITGGEPFRQNITPLVAKLLSMGYRVQIETNGTLPPPHDFPRHDNVTVVCSPKAGKINFQTEMLVDAFKYVMQADSVSGLDGLPILALNHTASPEVARPNMLHITGERIPIYLQPMDEQDPIKNARNLQAVKESCMHFGYILQLQIHKIIEVE